MAPVRHHGRFGLAAALATALAAGWLAGGPARPVARAPAQPAGEFRPEFLGVDLHARRVRPGDPLSYALRFRNAGSAPADRSLTVFVHLEREGAGCGSITAQQDHEPRVPTCAWRAGEPFVDGPRLLTIPEGAEEGEYRLHVGLFDRGGDLSRQLDARSESVRLDRGAVPAESWSPAAPAPAEAALRARSAARAPEGGLALHGDGWRFVLAEHGWELRDERTGCAFGSDPDGGPPATALVERGGFQEEVPIARFEHVERADGGLRATARVLLGAPPAVEVVLRVTATNDGAGARLEWSASGDGGRIAALRVLDHALQATDAQGGALLLPAYLGRLLPCDRGLPNDRSYRSRDLTLAMCGVLRREGALLAAWSGLGARLRTHLEVRDSPRVAGRRVASVSLDLPAGAAWLELRPLAQPDVPGVASAYRAVARREGLLRTWSAKKAERPLLERLEGAPVFRFTCLQRFAPRTRWNPQDSERVEAATTFAEVAAWAEHLRRDLGLERAHVIVAGWGREGYDRGLPDVLPANAESGGDAGLRDAARRVDALGFLLTLHDNTSDAYPDAPSFDPRMLRRDARGAPRSAGEWSAGQAWRVCPTVQLGLARRDFARIRDEYAPGALFLDTTLTPPLEPCFDRRHPLTLEGDLAARRRLFALAHERFGALGLEGIAEWAVPDADWLEGLNTARRRAGLGQVPVPLFSMVYGDCVRLEPIQSDRLDVADARKVLDLALLGLMPSFELGPHFAFRDPGRSVPVRAEAVGVVQIGADRVALRLRWHADGAVPAGLSAFVHLVRQDAEGPRGLEPQADHDFPRDTSTWAAGESVETSTPAIPLDPDDEGPWEVAVGLHDRGLRFPLEGATGVDGRATLALLRRDGVRLVLEPPPAAAVNSACFARGDGGWAAGRHPTDRLVKNVSDLLGPLNRLVAGRPLTGHAALAADGSAERTEFGGTCA